MRRTCGNCKHWERPGEMGIFGVCALITDGPRRNPELPALIAIETHKGGYKSSDAECRLLTPRMFACNRHEVLREE